MIQRAKNLHKRVYHGHELVEVDVPQFCRFISNAFPDVCNPADDGASSDDKMSHSETSPVTGTSRRLSTSLRGMPG